MTNALKHSGELRFGRICSIILDMSSAYHRAVLHIAKYPTQDVYGVFATRKETEKSVTCIPLFHSNCITVPIMRTAMSIIDELSGLDVVGLYFATSRPGTPPLLALLHSQIEASTGKNIRIYEFSIHVLSDSDSTSAPFRIVSLDHNCSLIEAEKSASMLFDSVRFVQDIENKNHILSVFDFEDHLDDPKRGWIQI